MSKKTPNAAAVARSVRKNQSVLMELICNQVIIGSLQSSRQRILLWK